MRYCALACDYDGTLARNGVVEEPTIAALRRFQAAGGRLLMVTGRELEDLRRVFPHTVLFERIVAENGAVLHWPTTDDTRLLCEPPPHQLISRLQQMGVQPLSVGHAILATWEPQEITVMEAIHELGLEYHIIFNKGAVMVLPAGVTKATGLKAALRDLGLDRKEVAGIGDAENDHAFLDSCGFSAAVANALPVLKEHVDLVTQASHGAGVAELINALLEEQEAPKLRAEALKGL